MLLVTLELRPIDVALVMALEENLAVVEGAAMAVGLPGATVDDLGAMFGFTVGVGAGVKRVLQHRNDIAVSDRRPLERNHLLAVRRPREMNAFGPQGEVDLPRAAKLTEPVENQPCGFLDPDVGIKTQPDLAMPDVADRDRDPELSPPRLGTGGVEHARTQNAKLELTNAALHAEQEPIVRATRVVDAVEIYDAGLHQAAKLEEVMPVAPVPREAGGVETQNGPDVAGAKPSNELLEPRPSDRAAGRATKVVVDNLNVAKSSASSLVDKLVLTPLTLEVDLNLGLGGLTDIDDSLPLEDGRGEELTVHYRCPPRTRPLPLPSAGGPTERPSRSVLTG